MTTPPTATAPAPTAAPTPTPTPTPAAPAPTPSPTPEPPKVDKFAEDMLKSLGKVLGPDGNIQDAPAPEKPVTPDAPKPNPSMTIGELAAEEERRKKANPEATPEPEAAPAPAPTPTPEPTPAPQPKPPKLVKKPATAPVAPPAPVVTPPAPAPAPAPTPTPTPSPDPDAGYVATLDEDQKGELEMAAFAETKFPEMKGKRAETLAFFKKVDDWAKAHPDAQPEEVDRFIAESKPKWKPGEKRRVEHAFITDQAVSVATQKAREEFEPKLAAAQKKLREQELNPVIDKATREFTDLISSSDIVPQNEGMEPIPADVSKRIAEVGYDKAMEEYRVEAPIVARSQNAAKEWLRLTNGLSQFDNGNPLHRWLFNFVENQGKIYAAKPESIVDGRRFIPMMQFLELNRTNPTEAQKFWTFSDQDVMNLIAVNANLQYNAELKGLEKSGFKREKKKNSPQPPNPTPAPTPAPTPTPASPSASPRMRAPTSPGAATPEKPINPNAKFLDTLVPGASERVSK